MDSLLFSDNHHKDFNKKNNMQREYILFKDAQLT